MKKNLPDYVRDDENLRQTLLAQEGFMKYVAEYIMNGGEDGLSLYAQYQEHVYTDYRKTNTWNGDAQLMSDDEFRLEALGPSNHLVKEFSCRNVFERSLSGLSEDAAEAARDYYDAYLAYAWRGFFERRNPDHATDVGFYRIFMEQFQHPNGLAYRSMELAVKDYYGEAWTNDDYYVFYRIVEYYYFYFDIKRRTGRLAYDRLRRGVKEWLEDKDDEECRELAVDMLEKVSLFSQTIYNEGYVQYLRDVKYPAEDKVHFALTGKHLNLDCFLEGAEEREKKGKWLREQINKAHLFKSDSILFYFTEFVFILKDIAHIWAARLLKEHNIDLHKLEEECRSFLLPYSPGKDGFDYSYYVDQYYNGDSPKTCCVKGKQKAKELLYALHKIESGDSPTHAAKETSQSDTVEEEPFTTRTKNLPIEGLDEEEEDGKGAPRTLPTADEAEKSMIKDKYNHFVEVTKQYNFTDCPAVKCLIKDYQGKLIWKIVEKRDAYGAYAVAMLCEIGYDDWMREIVKNVPGTKKITITVIIQHWAKALGLSERNVAGNYYVIRKKDSTQDKNLYTSHTQTINVHEDYTELKKRSDAARQKQQQKETDN